MKTYRVEMPDKGGPFFTLDGVQRRTGVKFMDSDFVSAFSSMEQLNKYFKGGIPKGCEIVVRDIPDELVIVFTTRIMFSKELLK